MFRTAENNELPQLVKIEASAHSHPWPVETFQQLHKRSDTVFTVIEKEGEVGIQGFAVVQQIADEATLLDIVVRPDCQGQGLGRRLLNYLLEELSGAATAHSFFLEVRVSNFSAISLYLSCGFVEVGERRDYYPLPEGGRENALIMACPLGVEAENF